MNDEFKKRKLSTNPEYAWKLKYSNGELVEDSKIKPDGYKLPSWQEIIRKHISTLVTRKDDSKFAYKFTDKLSANDMKAIEVHEKLHQEFVKYAHSSPRLFMIADAKIDAIILDHHHQQKQSKDIGVCSGCGITNEYQTESYVCFSCKE